MNYYITLDVGGTEIKACTINNCGKIVSKIKRFDSQAKSTKSQIIANFENIFNVFIPENEDILCGVGIAFPGEFDYTNGICLIKGIEKYDSIYGVCLKDIFTDYFKSSKWTNHISSKFTMKFINDVEAFALGEDTGKGRMIALAIGTGAGSCFLENGIAPQYGTAGVPPNGWVYNMPFRDNIIDNWVSKRGLMAIAQKHTGKALAGKELAQLCSSNQFAISAFEEFGQVLLEALSPFILEYRPKRFVLGGQITKSFALFGQPLEELCKINNIELIITDETSISAFKGLYSALTNTI